MDVNRKAETLKGNDSEKKEKNIDRVLMFRLFLNWYFWTSLRSYLLSYFF